MSQDIGQKSVYVIKHNVTEGRTDEYSLCDQKDKRLCLIDHW